MIKRERLDDHLFLQDTLNRAIHPQWWEQHYNWTRAILVESVELLDHVGWKWWKNQKPDQAQAHMELVDIWHFILSNELSRCNNDHVEALGNLLHGLKDRQFLVPMGYQNVDVRDLGTLGLIHVLAGSAAAGDANVTVFSMLMDQLGLTWEKLDLLYRTKNVLNVFRQKHGYLNGTYQKTWHGKEDNEVVYGLIEAKPDATIEQLTAKLEQIYSSLPESTLQ
jgi:dimeric dUTPase (all-alpha-NTP-PPase superfamily)